MKLLYGNETPMANLRSGGLQRRSITVILVSIALLIALFLLIFYNLPNFPSPWFDEGSHLHVPKSLVKFGEYADYSSEGFRYYGPSIGVGPTVMLPIALVFDLFGIGLLQARLVMALYLLAATAVFFYFVRNLGGRTVAIVSVLLLLSTRGVLFLETGRQVLGEVPGLLFMLLALYFWFSSWPTTKIPRLIAVGLLLGLAMTTKYQFLLFLAPTLALSWFLNLIYYKTLPQRVIIIPALVSGLVFGLWGLFILAFLGPAEFSENFSLLRESIAGAALIFDPAVMSTNLETLTGRAVYLGALIPALLYGITLIFPKKLQNQKYSFLLILLGVNLVWFMVASIGWLRYAFLGLSIAAIFVAQFFIDATGGFALGGRSFLSRLWKNGEIEPRLMFNWAMILWLAVIIMVPMVRTVAEIFTANDNPAQEMASYLNETVPLTKEIETWEPEMGFLTDHNYHYPPTPLLNKANAYVFLGGEPVSDSYDYLETNEPDYVLIGNFAAWVELYPYDLLEADYTPLQSFGNYTLYSRLE